MGQEHPVRNHTPSRKAVLEEARLWIFMNDEDAGFFMDQVCMLLASTKGPMFLQAMLGHGREKLYEEAREKRKAKRKRTIHIAVPAKAFRGISEKK